MANRLKNPFESTNLRNRLTAVVAIGVTALGGGLLSGCSTGGGDKAPTVATATQSGDATPSASPSASETKTASPEKWLPSRGDFLSPDKMAGMSEDELREACSISVDDPDAQTPEGLIRLMDYITISALNAPTTDDQMDPYRTSDGQVPIPAQDEFMNTVPARYATCIESLLNDGLQRKPSNFAKYIASVYGAQENIDPAGQYEPYRIQSEVVGDVQVADDGTYSYATDQSDNREKTIVPQLGSEWTPQWGGHHKATVRVSQKGGKFVFTNRTYETTAS